MNRLIAIFQEVLPLLKNVDLFLLPTYNATFDMHTLFAEIFYLIMLQLLRFIKNYELYICNG